MCFSSPLMLMLLCCWMVWLAGMASSMVATIGYAWLLENMENKEGGEGVVVPVMNLKRRSMQTHRQVAWLFHYLGIDASALLFSDEVSPNSILENSLLSQLSHNNALVLKFCLIANTINLHPLFLD